jgi:pimeloyl-ACP methyl ester carboxylesterase
LAIVLVFLSGAGLPALGDGLAAAQAGCDRLDVEVRLVPEGPAEHRLVGWLCAEVAFPGQTVVIASHPATADHNYWDWPDEGEAFSFVRAATAAGYAVFIYDRIGAGLSDRPAAALVTLASGAYVLEQLGAGLRDGSIGGNPFGSVVLLGNSYGTLISIFAAEVYGTFDGVVNTGVLVGPHPQGLLELFALFHPVQNDPKFADAGLPLGYMTTVPGGRDTLFYLPTAEPAVLARDEELKDTVTMPEAATFGLWSAGTRVVDVPVLSVVGDRDFLFCRPRCEPDGLEAGKEPLFWGPETCFELQLVNDAGHSLQLHRHAADAFHGILIDWLGRYVGDGNAPASGPCNGSPTLG